MLWRGHDGCMFVVHCPACGQHELRSIHALTGLANTTRGIELTVTCSNCGAHVRVVTGRKVTDGPVALAAAPTGATAGTGDPCPADRPAA
jgi:uncharacterized Zn finger protein